MKMLQFALSALALSASVAMAADQPAGHMGPRAICKTDAATLCAGILPGNGRVAACLRQNEAKVSPACKDVLAKVKDKSPAVPVSKPGSAQ